MLYDHSDDPGENVNVAVAEGRKEAVTELTEQLHQRMGSDAQTTVQPGKVAEIAWPFSTSNPYY
jgi:hypothetical protein